MVVTKVDTQKAGYPKFPADNWWALRKRFVQSIQVTVNDGYVAAVLQMKPSSARVRIASLKKVGLIGDDGRPTERAKRWRDDSQYTAVCEEIRQDVYPPELLHAFPAPSPDRAEVARWFGHEAGVGEDAANQLASFYLLLCEADPTKQDGGTAARTVRPGRTSSSAMKTSGTRSRTSAAGTDSGKDSANGAAQQPAQSPLHSTRGELSLHVDIQIHISPEATAEQIDQIFRSINTHLRKGSDSE